MLPAVTAAGRFGSDGTVRLRRYDSTRSTVTAVSGSLTTKEVVNVGAHSTVCASNSTTLSTRHTLRHALTALSGTRRMVKARTGA